MSMFRFMEKTKGEAMEKKYYIAYGSNLNAEEMSWRCPTARVVGSGMLRDYRLLFCVFATIVPEKGCSVPVAVWEIDEKCEEKLDIYERYPSFYRKEYLDVDIGGEIIRAMVYIMNGGRARLPGEDYLEVIRQGYRDMSLDEIYLDDALSYTKSQTAE